ncbi:MAG: helix-turn-helix transcriptional regulator [Prolixibacteraceae bacterium]|jgi:transcriptional regulator with XRE-family HTH domain|nr:helix-turn-helix transcriptional regulator [Prolixibacteraceae bacterium]MBT6005851.1 helix-turn-helix transcriptional regulator [Prolixibacteraceae bacterium]MBT6764690.1 helix-turn-helix transcriptional regulator [Prolixibacteraceae bacterium]MBT6999827.1 helix-turn-helix transcriptional regulator [Prolixibacteraceae bacterium]MBT7397185.1 helix-turn-helix transcriptional regulator [Prolixibacteraceae bacterium]
MATFGDFLRSERQKKGLNQSDFGQIFGIIMTDISKIENGHKRFPYANLKKLAEFLEIDFIKIKNLFVAHILVEEAHKYQCSDVVFSVAESQSKYIKEKNVKQGKMNF